MIHKHLFETNLGACEKWLGEETKFGRCGSILRCGVVLVRSSLTVGECWLRQWQLAPKDRQAPIPAGRRVWLLLSLAPPAPDPPGRDPTRHVPHRAAPRLTTWFPSLPWGDGVNWSSLLPLPMGLFSCQILMSYGCYNPANNCSVYFILLYSCLVSVWLCVDVHCTAPTNFLISMDRSIGGQLNAELQQFWLRIAAFLKKSEYIYTVNAVIEYPREYELRSNPTP